MGGGSSENKVHHDDNREKRKEREKDYNESNVTENNVRKKKKNKKKLEKDRTDSVVNEGVECLKENKEEELSEINNVKVDKKKKKKQKVHEVDDGVVTDSVVDVDGISAKSLDENLNSQVELRKKEKKRKKNGNVDSASQLSESMEKKHINEDREKMVKGNDGGENACNLEREKDEVDRTRENGSGKDSKKRKRDKDSGGEVETKKKSSKLGNGKGESPVKERKKKKKSDSCVQLEAASEEIAKDGKDGGSKNLDGGKKVKKKNVTKANKSAGGNNTSTAQESGKGVESTDSLENSALKKKSKTVSFSEDVEIFPPEDMETTPSSSKSNHRKGKETDGEGGVIWGKRFSKEEDEMLKEAVNDYIINHDMEDDKDAIEKIMNCRKHPEVRKCWREIGAALPWRPMQAVYYRAHILYQRADTRAWTQEELDAVRKFHQKYGSDWKTIAEKLGKHRFHVKDAWRRIKLENSKRGHWSQDEYQNLFDLVNQNLRMRTLAERKTKHGMLRDNISWTAISEKLETRHDALCCMKWYKQLTSPMVAKGEWLDTDDYRLLIALYELDACCMEDVDWDYLLEHRSGDVCRKRWNEMVKHLGVVGNKSFADLLDILLDRYCPDVLEAREIYDSKTPVDE